MSEYDKQNRGAVWGSHSDERLRATAALQKSMCDEDLEALPEILDHCEETGRISVVTDWLEKHGYMQSGGNNELLRPLVDLLLASRSGEIRLALECAALALDLDLATQSKTLSAIAVRYGIARQSVDRRFKRICSILKINDTIVSKSKSASESYRLCNHRQPKTK